ncbi:VirK/YbjX family protein [Lonepinella sp. MS14436]|uniref:VirK/YbjX family protein n=1 Tax=Lonepinella sp. MS14436 TaxID=3003619 RepID=UPI0036DAA553
MFNLASLITFKKMFPVEKRLLKLSREYLRYQMRLVVYKKQIQCLSDYLVANPIWQPIFQNDIYRINTLLNKFCDKRFNGTERLKAIMQNFSLAEQFLPVDKVHVLLEKEKVLLAKLTDELDLYLNLNRVDPLEGFFSLNIVDQQKNRIYDASFTFLSPNKLLIASIQGPNHEQAQLAVRNATKALHGVRPMFMLVNVFKIFASQLGCELIGIPHKYEAKYRWNDSKDLLFNYDEFWQENDAQYHDKYWQLPSQIERKPLEEIASKKRSMYRKRYEMFDALEQQMKDFLMK